MITELLLVAVCLISADQEGSSGADVPESGLTEQKTAESVPVESRDVQEWELRYKFREGQTLRYETKQKMTLEAQMGAKKAVDISELKQRRVFTVQSVDERGAARIAMQFESVWMKKTTDDQPSQEFDSSMKAADVPMAFRQVAHQLRGSAARYWIDSTGNSMFAAESQKARRAAMSEGDGGGNVIRLVEGNSGKDAIELPVQAATHNDGIKEAADPGSFLMMLPELKVRIGDSWKETIRLPVRLNNDINMEVPVLRAFRLESVDGDIATISFRCSLQAPVKNVTALAQLIQATPRGTIRLDIARGVMISRDMRYDETVFHALGPESLLTSVGNNFEQLIDDEAHRTGAAPNSAGAEVPAASEKVETANP